MRGLPCKRWTLAVWGHRPSAPSSPRPSTWLIGTYRRFWTRAGAEREARMLNGLPGCTSGWVSYEVVEDPDPGSVWRKWLDRPTRVG